MPSERTFPNNLPISTKDIFEVWDFASLIVALRWNGAQSGRAFASSLQNITDFHCHSSGTANAGAHGDRLQHGKTDRLLLHVR